MIQLEKEIIDALANDYENLDQMHQIMNQSRKNTSIVDTLWSLIQEGYIACFLPVAAEMRLITQPERSLLSDYWLALTEKGEQLLARF
jgi:hypothetical protein